MHPAHVLVMLLDKAFYLQYHLQSGIVEEKDIVQVSFGLGSYGQVFLKHL